MTEKTRRQLGILGILVAGFVAVMFVVSRGEGPAGTATVASTRAGRAGAEAGIPQVADVNLEALKAEHDPPAVPERNLFAFRQRVAPAPRVPIQAERPITPQIPQGPPPLPPIPLKYIGLLERPGDNGRVAILSDGRGNTFHAREGEDVDGRYKIIRIGTDSIELSYVDGRGHQTLRLSGQ